MVANMKVGKMDGYCVGEPWNNRAIEDGIGFTAITTQKMWKDHPEKVCAFTEEFALKNPKTVKAVLKALHLRQRAPRRHEQPAEGGRDHLAPGVHQLSAGHHPRAPAGQVRVRRRPRGAGPELHDLLAAQLQLPAAGLRPVVADAAAALGLHQGRADYAGLPKKVMRPDLYMDAMKEMGVKVTPPNDTKITLFDSVFDSKDPEKYARSFAINSLQG
jgi:nitrate/nitrite transport system substrate-binding protein